MKVPFGALLLGTAVFSGAVKCVAQGGPHLDAGSTAAVNPTGYPVQLLLLHTNAQGLTDGHEVVRVEPNSQIAFHLPGDAKIGGLMFLDASIPKTRVPACLAGPPRIKLTKALVREQLAMTEHAVGQNMSETEAAAAAKAAVGNQQAMDEMSTRLSDPATAAKYQLMRDSATTQAQINAANEEQTTEAAADVLLGGIGAAMANAALISEHSAQSKKEADSLQQVIDSNNKFLAQVQSNYNSEQVLVSAGREFNAKGAAVLSSSVAKVEVPKSVEFGRLCDGAANDSDTLALKLEAPDNVKVLLARSHFDHGGDEDLVFNRIAGTPQWVATVFWPLDATAATVSLHTGATWAKLGEVKTGRDSVEKQVSDAKKSLGSLKKAHRSASYAAEGGDEARTTIIP